MKVTWWGLRWPWQWRFYLVRRSKWGPFGELLLGPVGFTWPTTGDICQRCGSGLVGGEHIADYPPCYGDSLGSAGHYLRREIANMEAVEATQPDDEEASL